MNKKYIHVLLNKARGDDRGTCDAAKMSAKDAFLETEKELKRLNSIIRNKKASDLHIGNSIFQTLRGEVTTNVINTYASDHFTAGYYSFTDLKEEMLRDKCFDEIGIQKYGYIIITLLFDIKNFANYIGRKKDPSYLFFSGGKSNTEDSIWHYRGSKQLLYNCVFDKNVLDSKFALILSAVSLRQTLELKMQRILGVFDYSDLLGNKIFTKHHFFFDFITENKQHFDLSSINIKTIQKIFEFCNISVHKGIMPYFWQMHYATRFCDPLFSDPDYNKRKNWNIHSAVRITGYKELRVKLKNTLTKLFPKPDYKLHIEWINPEAQLLD